MNFHVYGKNISMPVCVMFPFSSTGFPLFLNRLRPPLIFRIKISGAHNTIVCIIVDKYLNYFSNCIQRIKDTNLILLQKKCKKKLIATMLTSYHNFFFYFEILDRWNIRR